MSTRGRKITKKVEKVEVVEPVVTSDKEETKEEVDEHDYDEIVKKATEELKEVKFETNDPEVETPPQTKTKSIADFDYDDVERLDTGAVKALDSVTLLKLLIVRGKKVLNPTLWKGAQETLRRLNGELGQQDFGNRRDFNRGRNRFPPRNQAPQAPQFQQEQHTEERQFDRPNQDRQFDRRSGQRGNFRPSDGSFVRQQGRENFNGSDNSNFGSRFQ